MNSAILNVGKTLLNGINTASGVQSSIKHKLISYRINDASTEEMQSWFVCILALQALTFGNFGVGSAIFDKDNCLVEYAGNQVFSPKFRSDAHAEMMVLTNFESKQDRRIDLSSYTLVTSLESCPMCLIRLISAQVGKVLHVCDDDLAGMTRNTDSFPPLWRKLQSTVQFRPTTCSTQIREIAQEIFMCNVNQLTSVLIQPI
ncbi:nucleoside deaminase [Methylomonas sp. MgM2]